MWTHLPIDALQPDGPDDPRCGWLNVTDLQRVAALKRLERTIVADNAAGCGVDSDRALDQWVELRDLIRKGAVS
jgi:hypothetical protein